MPVYLLIDNGSKKAEATLCLRELAVKLSKKTGKHIYAVSLQHADAIDKSLLSNIPAEIFSAFLRQQLQQGEREFIVVPLFFGESRALTSFIPDKVTELQNEFGLFNVKLAEVIYPLPAREDRLADILFDHVQIINSQKLSQLKNIVLVDHGSPVPQITEVRKQVAVTLQSLLGPDVKLGQAVMERREGSEYDFNGDLLEDWLKAQATKNVKNIIVAMLFFLPGRHAGDCGDVQQICDRVMAQYPDTAISITPLISEHETLITILEDRLLAAESE